MTVSRVQIAVFGRAGIVVIAHFLGSAHAEGFFTRIAESAWVSIFTRKIDDFMHTPTLGVASVVGALNAIVTRQHRAIALSLYALVIGGAQTSVVAKVLIGVIRAPCFGRASIVGAWIVVEALRLHLTYTKSGDTLVFIGAEIAVLAQGSIGDIQKETVSRDVVASTGYGAGIVVFGAGHFRSYAGSVLTGVNEGTGISIVAGGAVGNLFKNTSCGGVACICGAPFAVVANHIDGPHAGPRFPTRILFGASVAVVAGFTDQRGWSAGTGFAVQAPSTTRVIRNPAICTKQGVLEVRHVRCRITFIPKRSRGRIDLGHGAFFPCFQPRIQSSFSATQCEEEPENQKCTFHARSPRRVESSNSPGARMQ